MVNFLSQIIVVLLISLILVFLYVINGNLLQAKLAMLKSILVPINQPDQTRLKRPEPPIPRHIIQVSQSKLNDPSTSSFVRLNPNHTYYSFDDQEADEFVQKHMPSNVVQTYMSMPKRILKSDFFRYIAMMVLGGVYSDMDTECLHPIDTWIDVPRERVGLIISVEMDNGAYAHGFVRPLQICQWTFAGIARHPILRSAVEKIVTIAPQMLAQKMSYYVVMNWTGPGLWSGVVLDYLHHHLKVDAVSLLSRLKHPVLIGDVYVLPKYTFGSYRGRAGGKQDPKTHVRHFFAGSWKKDKEMKLGR